MTSLQVQNTEVAATITELPLPARVFSKNPRSNDIGRPSVSVVVPMRNEAATIDACLRSILAQIYAGPVELIIVDGMSEDRSVQIVNRYIEAHPFIRLLENPARITSAALNIGIRAATGEIIVRVDGHTILAADYVQQCVDMLKYTGAGNVGGLQRAVGTSYVGTAIALILGSPLAVGDAKFRYASEERFTDTVYLGAFPRAVFDEIGGFDESLERNQDYELNCRLRAHGYGVFLTPKIRSTYIARNNLSSFGKQYFQYGRWKAEMLRRNPETLRWRQAVAPVFVAALFTVGLGSILYPPFLRFFQLILVIYVLYILFSSAFAAKLENWRYLPILPVLMIMMHLSWGMGFWWGLINRPVVSSTSN